MVSNLYLLKENEHHLSLHSLHLHLSQLPRALFDDILTAERVRARHHESRSEEPA